MENEDTMSAPRSPTGSTTSKPPMVVADHAKSSVSKKEEDYDRAKTCARERAEEVQKNLDPEHPSFLKSMKASHVGGCFMMSLPTPFCNSYLPKKDIMITLVDENETTSIVRYVGKGFSGAGWRAFSTSHNLVVGDALVFQLVNPAEFQVFVIRAYSSSGFDWGFGLQYSDARVKRSTPQVSASAEAQSKDIDKAEQVLADHDESSGRKGAFANDDDDSVKTCAREQEEEVVADHAESSQRNGALTNDSAKTSARVQAEEVQKSLDPKHPSFLKSVVKSHVSGCYHMYLPTKFCNSYLPENDYIITLVDENKAICTVQYMDKVFRGGWKAFSIGHNLVEGDAMVFHLVKRTEFQVYVIRAQSSSRVDFGSGLQKSEARVKRIAPRIYFPLEARSNTINKVEEGADHAGTARAKPCAIEQAEEVQRKLDPNYPSFVKAMFPSNVSGSFWLALPSKFCASHLPKNDIMITLIDVKDEEYTVKYIVKALAVSAGWRIFAVAHKLAEGDALVFQLVEDVKFKVYIVRTDGSSGDNEGSGLCSLNVKAKQSAPCKRTKRLSTPEKTERKRRKTPLSTDFGPEEEKPKISRRDAGSEVSRGTILRGNLDTECILTAVDGLKQNSKLSEHIWLKYSDLCCSQKDLLHKNLPQGNHELVDGIISETVMMADRIKACNLSTTSDEFDAWEKCLKEHDSKERKEALAQQARMSGEIKTLEAKLVDLKDAAEKLDTEVAKHTKNTESRELELQKELDAPW
ncbi:hypothetical protein GIB67_003949 [Kingdonia uniflora]|uniref:TF-B3 domain-containing protein n=1 Tax=Kingdonia uniflora TaxID=39325 RepID=A0A7J7P810_9MAGN|nr:hypothetical protein GIB67_003949 [Kingdonia uniflora]